MQELLTLPFLLLYQSSRLYANHEALAAENRFLRQQIKLLLQSGKRPRRATEVERLILALLSKFFDWRAALFVVKPATFIRWHREAFRRFWKRKSRKKGPGRPKIPAKVRHLILEMALDNPLWGEERIASEILLKLGLQLSPRTVRKYMPKPPRGGGRRGQSWSTFFQNHGKAILACDFCTIATLSFQVLHVFLVMSIESRKVLHIDVTKRPTSAWTLQQLREALSRKHIFRWLVHDRDSIFSKKLDRSLNSMGLTVRKTPPRTPVANAHCERVIGTLRRECLDHVIPLSENHLRLVVTEWTEHYNRGRPHSSLGPGLPVLSSDLPVKRQPHRHVLPAGSRVDCMPVLGGLHHEYGLEMAA